MKGRAEVARMRQSLDATFQRVAGVGDDLELQSDFARYLCVLVSGYLEKAVAELVLEHARQCGAPSLQRFVELNTRRFTNANAQGLQNLLGSFNPDWRQEFEAFLDDELALVQFNGIFRINRPEPFENTAHCRKAGDMHNCLILPVFPLN